MDAEIPGGRSAILDPRDPEGIDVHTQPPLAVGDRLRVVAVSVLAERHPDAGRVGETCIDKRPVEGRVPVGPEGLRGDWQADRVHHGGPEKALFALSCEAGEHWSSLRGSKDVPGFYGENLRVDGDLDRLEIGARVRIGDVEAIVTGTRNPCMTLSRWVQRTGFVREYAQFGKVGLYFAVLSEGTVAAGDAVDVVSTPGHGVSCDRWFTGRLTADARRILEAERDGRLVVADFMRPYITNAAKRDPHV